MVQRSDGEKHALLNCDVLKNRAQGLHTMQSTACMVTSGLCQFCNGHVKIVPLVMYCTAGKWVSLSGRSGAE